MSDDRTVGIRLRDFGPKEIVCPNCKTIVVHKLPDQKKAKPKNSTPPVEEINLDD